MPPRAKADYFRCVNQIAARNQPNVAYRSFGTGGVLTALSARKGCAPMKIILISYFGSLVMLVINKPGALSRRLMALRGWPSQKNRHIHQ
jgi:hypothetical protein